MSRLRCVVVVVLASTVLMPSMASARRERVDAVHDRCMSARDSSAPALVGSTNSCLRLQACSYWVPDLFGGLVPASSDCSPLFCVAVSARAGELEEIGISDCSPPGKLEILIGAAAQAARDSLRNSSGTFNKDAPAFKGIYIFGYRTFTTPCGARTAAMTYRQALMFKNSRKSKTVSKTGSSKVKMSVAMRTGMATVSYPTTFIRSVTEVKPGYSWTTVPTNPAPVTWTPGVSPVLPLNPSKLPIIFGQ